MTLGTPALWAGSATHPIRVPRNAGPTYLGLPMIAHANSATATTRGGGYGVVCGGDLAVTSTGGVNYSIAAGRFALPGTFATAQGGYVDYNDAAVAGSLPARDATNPYIVYICARVRDTDEDATGAEITDFTVIQGTPNATPAAPSVPSSLGSLLIISQALVPSNANGGPVVFTERRMYLAAIGARQRVTSANRPTGAALWQGVHIHELDTNYRLAYNGSAWVNDGSQDTFYLGIIPGANTDTAGNTFFTQWAAGNITVPAWATSAYVTTTVDGAFDPSNTGDTFQLRARIGATGGYPFNFNGPPTLNFRMLPITWTDQITLPGTGTQAFAVDGLRTGGSTGILRADTSSAFRFLVTFV